jgi:hypothetical protein
MRLVIQSCSGSILWKAGLKEITRGAKDGGRFLVRSPRKRISGRKRTQSKRFGFRYDLHLDSNCIKTMEIDDYRSISHLLINIGVFHRQALQIITSTNHFVDQIWYQMWNKRRRSTRFSNTIIMNNNVSFFGGFIIATPLLQEEIWYFLIDVDKLDVYLDIAHSSLFTRRLIASSSETFSHKLTFKKQSPSEWLVSTSSVCIASVWSTAVADLREHHCWSCIHIICDSREPRSPLLQWKGKFSTWTPIRHPLYNLSRAWNQDQRQSPSR